MICSISLYDQQVSSYMYFVTISPNDPKRPWTLYEIDCICFTSTHEIRPKFQSNSVYYQPFWATGQFKTSARNHPKWPWTLRGERYDMFYLCPWVPHFCLFHFAVSHFRVTGLLRQMLPMTPGDLEYYEPNVPLLNGIPQVPKFRLFHLGLVHRVASRLHWTSRGQRCPS